MPQLSGTWYLSQDLMAPKGYEAVCQGEPSDMVHANGYHTLDEVLYDGNEWDDCRSGKRTPPARSSFDQQQDFPSDPCEWDRDYSNAWDYASLADQARRRSGTVSSSGSSCGSNSGNSSPTTKTEKIFDATEEVQSSSTDNNARAGGFWGFFGRARTQEPKVESFRGASG